MSSWTQLSSSVANQVYYVPLAITQNNNNHFFAPSVKSHEFDEQFPFVAFLQDRSRLDVLIFSICTVNETLEGFEGFNPLHTKLGGYLNLDEQQAFDLAELLINESNHLYLTDSSSKSFEKLDMSIARRLNLYTERSKQAIDLYYQKDKTWLSNEESLYTLILFSKSSYTKFRLQIMQFPLSALNNPRFTPYNQSEARITLDKSGVLELANLIKSNLSI